MILKWIPLVRRESVLAGTKQADEEKRKTSKDAKLIDVAYETLSETAARDHSTLEALLHMGWPHVQREKLKTKIRKKVWDVVNEKAGIPDHDMVEEITERLTEVAEVDKYYKKMLDGKEP